MRLRFALLRCCRFRFVRYEVLAFIAVMGYQLNMTVVDLTCRDAQRFTSRLSPDEANRLRMAQGSYSAYNARRLQQQGVSGGLPILTGLPNPNDLSMVPTSTAMMGLSRGLSLPRTGMPSMASPVVPNMTSAGLSGLVPPAGTFPPNMARRNPTLLNHLRVSFDLDDSTTLSRFLSFSSVALCCTALAFRNACYPVNCRS